jgi:hypothetical protein
MRGMAGIGPLAWQRLRASWRLLSVLALGILAAATLMAVSPVYTRVMNDLGLTYSLNQQLRASTRNSVAIFALPLGTEQAAASRESLARLMASRISWLIGSEERYSALPNLSLAAPGQPPPNDPLRTMLQVQSLTNFETHTRVVEGRAARPATSPAEVEAVIPLEAARFLELRPGDQIAAAQVVDDCNRPPPTDDPVETPRSP